MANFDRDLWLEIAPRFRELRGEKKVEKFLAEHDFFGIKWRHVEDGRQGISVESLVKICRALDVSPTWLLFGIGRQTMSEIVIPHQRFVSLAARVDTQFKTVPQHVRRELMAMVEEGLTNEGMSGAIPHQPETPKPTNTRPNRKKAR